MDRINEYLNLYKIPIVFSLVGIVLIIGGIFSSKLLEKPQVQKNYPKESIVKKESLSKDIKIDVSGAVNIPGVYGLPADSRVEDAIKSAGGLSDDANTEFVTKKLNLSQKLTDGTKVYIPSEGEAVTPVSAGAVVLGVSSNQTGKIGINSASVLQLEGLPAVGAVTAQKIINGRPYASIEDLTAKKVISRTTLDKIRDLIDVN